MIDYELIAAKILARGETEHGFLQTAGVSKNTMSRLRKGHSIHPGTLTKIALGLGLQRKELITRLQGLGRPDP
jgi:DNA-binding Xre family transcriptional regulator